MVVVGVVLIGLLVVVALLAAGAVAVIDVHRQTQAAADLAALAGAVAAQDGRDPCAGADAIARRNGATEVACATDGTIVTVTVARPLGIAGLTLTLHARSRAGPAEMGHGL